MAELEGAITSENKIYMLRYMRCRSSTEGGGAFASAFRDRKNGHACSALRAEDREQGASVTLVLRLDARRDPSSGLPLGCRRRVSAFRGAPGTKMA